MKLDWGYYTEHETVEAIKAELKKNDLYYCNTDSVGINGKGNVCIEFCGSFSDRRELYEVMKGLGYRQWDTTDLGECTNKTNDGKEWWAFVHYFEKV